MYYFCTVLPVTYHIGRSDIEFYIHRITFSASVQLFVPQNELIHIRCNIGTGSHLLFIRAPRSKFKECLGKVLLPLEFIQFRMIVILIWNEWFGCIHTIRVWKINTSLLLFYDFLFHNPYPIIWLLHLCHL